MLHNHWSRSSLDGGEIGSIHLLLLAFDLFVLCFGLVLFKQPGLGPQDSKRQRSNCSHFNIAPWAIFLVFRCAMKVQHLWQEWLRVFYPLYYLGPISGCL